jgi:hypothetical protein
MCCAGLVITVVPSKALLYWIKIVLVAVAGADNSQIVLPAPEVPGAPQSATSDGMKPYVLCQEYLEHTSSREPTHDLPHCVPEALERRHLPRRVAMGQELLVSSDR